MSSSDVGERAPLLHPSNEQENLTPRWKVWRWPRNTWKFFSNNPILLCTFCVQFLNYLAKHMVEVPTIKLIEQAICNRYYVTQGRNQGLSKMDIDEGLCKAPTIQDELATITGLKFTFDALPALVTALYYGSIADRFGRRLVLLLCCVGTMCSYLWILFVCYAQFDVPVKLIWVSSVFLFLGGSQRVAKSMNFTVVADATEASHRTRFMYLLAGIPHATTLIAPPVSGTLMKINIWIPFVVSISSLALSFILILLMPESLNHPSNKTENDPLLSPGDTTIDNDNRSSERAAQPPNTEDQPRDIHTIPSHQPLSHKAWWRDILTLLQKPGLPFCYILFFLKPTAMISKAYVYQYASWNFHWQLAATTWLRFSQAGGSSLLTIVVLPLLTWFLMKREKKKHHHYHQQRRGDLGVSRRLDINVIRVSLLVAVIGFLVLQFSVKGWMLVVGLFILGLSEGEEPALQGLTTSLIDKTHHARLFTSVAVVEIVAKLVGGPAMGRLFAICRRDGTGSMGVCFVVSAGILMGLLIMALLQRVGVGVGVGVGRR